VIYVLPYKAHDFVESLKKTIEDINMEAMNIPNIVVLNTTELLEEQKSNENIDFVCAY
jgi:ABC-type enterochelin transport system ATPase subunit